MLEGIKPGDPLPSIEKSIDQERILKWAELSGDFNRLHVDPEYAQQTPFKGTIAHGPMSLAFLNELMVRCFEERWAEGGRLMDVRFLAPIRPGDTVRIGGMVKQIEKRDDGDWVESEIFIEKGVGDRAVVGRSIARIDTGKGK